MERVIKHLIICILVLASSTLSSTIMAQTIKPLSGTKGASTINKGVKHFNQGQLNHALTHFQQALKKNPRSAVAHYNMALTFNRMGQSDKATKHFQQASKLGQMNSFIRNSRILQQHLLASEHK